MLVPNGFKMERDPDLQHASPVGTLSHFKMEFSSQLSQLCRDGLEKDHCALHIRQHLTIWESYILGTTVLFWVICNVHGASNIFSFYSAEAEFSSSLPPTLSSFFHIFLKITNSPFPFLNTCNLQTEILQLLEVPGMGLNLSKAVLAVPIQNHYICFLL